MIASLVLGGSAATATIGTEVYNHAQRQGDTHQLAQKIVAWYQVVTSISWVLEELQRQQKQQLAEATTMVMEDGDRDGQSVEEAETSILMSHTEEAKQEFAPPATGDSRGN